MKDLRCLVGKIVNNNWGTRGFTLLELLMVMSLVGILAGVATWGGRQVMHGWQLKRAGHQLLEDLKALQGQAERSGNLTMHNGSLVMQRTFLVFEPEALNYAAYIWKDRNANGVAEAGETDQLWQNSLPPGVFFGWAPGINRRACSNVSGSPGRAISFSSPNYAPCYDKPCIKFDSNGFSVMGPGAVYLQDETQSLAITGTRPGHFTMCEWGGEKWR